jgi:hypothetical protein
MRPADCVRISDGLSELLHGARTGWRKPARDFLASTALIARAAAATLDLKVKVMIGWS